jgi:hypothetical protein
LQDGSRKLLNGYGAPPPPVVTIAENIKEAAAPALDAAIDRVVDASKRISPFLVETLGVDVSGAKAAKLGIGMMLLFRLRHKPMAAYLVIPAYFAWETVGWPVTLRLWDVFGPQASGYPLDLAQCLQCMWTRRYSHGFSVWCRWARK